MDINKGDNRKTVPVSSSQAESIGVFGLGFIAQNEKLLARFLSMTGIEAGMIRQAAAEPGFLAGVLGFIIAHEPTLLEFCEQSGFAPQDVERAVSALPGGQAGEPPHVWDQP